LNDVHNIVNAVGIAGFSFSKAVLEEAKRYGMGLIKRGVSGKRRRRLKLRGDFPFLMVIY
jgi:hypothetical protein